MKIAITLGDPSGISPEILVKSKTYLPEETYIIYGSEQPLKVASKITGINFPIKKISSPDEAKEKGFYLIQTYEGKFTPGKPDIKSGKASISYLEKAVNDILEKKTSCLITLPISKEFIMKSGFKYPGHTDYLAKKSKTKNYLMMLMCKKLKVALATTHIPLKQVPHELTKPNLKEKLLLLNEEIKSKFKIKIPKIAVLGLNPHSGDGGKIGTEELEIIKPVIKELRKKGIHLTEPLSPDTAFINYTRYDVFFAMYHDQGLIPLKLLCFKTAINITLGLPFIRTSPDHGTGFDIAGKNIADPTSFIEAVLTAISLTQD